jgi:dihydroxyacetone synthase
MSSPTDSVQTADESFSRAKQDDQAVREVRKLVIDICRQNGGGHGGSAIGMAPMAVALWKYAMRYNPSNPEVSISRDIIIQRH